jgi:hypothetical protein
MNNNKYIKIVILIALSIILLFAAKDNVLAAYRIFSETDDEYTKISADYENMCENIKNKKLYEEKLRYMNRKINNLNIMTNIKQEQIITVLNELLSSSSIEASSIDLSEISDINNVGTASTDDMKEDKITSSLVSVSFRAFYNDMLKFMDEIQVCKTGAEIKSVRFVMNDNDEVYGTIDFVFYSLAMDEAYE